MAFPVNSLPATQSITCQNLSYVVQSNRLVDQLNSDFLAGKISVILGKNGAGKSTLLSLMTKELEPHEGDVLWQETSLSTLTFAELAQQRAVLPQLQNIVFSISVQQLIELGAEVQKEGKVDPQNIQQIALEVMQICDVTHLAQRDVMTLSGGEQKRAQLARVLAQIWPLKAMNSHHLKPFEGKWLFLDEWTTSLDLHHQQQLSAFFTQWAQQGLGIIMVLHDLNLTSQIADNVKILQDGKLVLEGEPKEVLTPHNINLTLGLNVVVLPLDGAKNPMIVTDFSHS
ncbi:ATP-binding cassette domain-containing protein [Thiomicrorhabdus sp. Milos-T2]|uniref:ATP-binding cassette domain-containing protein n=1 Tax=Thiomicrorhabdus sp. Milos-T2 TaxID=90814 RepID=UPI00068A6929|nr:ATP-binding cassette domain-containing protein [Thiomicrorhabdus sp. Milos-T2]